jgi:hypothetical protein
VLSDVGSSTRPRGRWCSARRCSTTSAGS